MSEQGDLVTKIDVIPDLAGLDSFDAAIERAIGKVNQLDAAIKRVNNLKPASPYAPRNTAAAPSVATTAAVATIAATGANLITRTPLADTVRKEAQKVARAAAEGVGAGVGEKISIPASNLYRLPRSNEFGGYLPPPPRNPSAGGIVPPLGGNPAGGLNSHNSGGAAVGASRRGFNVFGDGNADQFNVTGRVVYLEGADVLHELSTAQESQVVPAIASIKNQYNKFFMCMTTSRNLTIQKAIADWVESQIDKMGVFIDDYTSSTWATDSITKYLHDKNLSGSFAISTKKPKNFLDAAIAGRCLVMQPGSETWALKTLNGVMSDDFTETDYQKIIALNGNTFEDYGSGVTVTYPGTCGDGESIEVVRFAYWQADRMQKDLATLFVNRNKVGHDMPGYEVVCNKMESSLKAGQSAGGIIENFTDENGDLIRGFEVFRPTMAEVSAVQRIKGDLIVKFQFYLRHAIKHVDAIGTGMTYGI